MIATDGVRTIANAPALTTLGLPANPDPRPDENVDEPRPRPLVHFFDYLSRVTDAGLYVTLKMGDSELEGQLCPDLSTGGVTAIREVLDLITVVPTDMIDGVKFDERDADYIDLETPLAHDHRRYDF